MQQPVPPVHSTRLRTSGNAVNESTFEVRLRVAETVEPIRVVLACRRRLITLGLKAMIDASPEVEFVGVAVVPDALYVYLQRGRVDVLLCAWREYEYARATIEAVRQDYPDLRVCVIAEKADPTIIRDAFVLGATGFVSEACNDEQVIDALVRTGTGRTAIETGSRRADDSLAPDDIVDVDILSEREREILTLMAVGLSTRDIANTLFLSPKTVETHRANMMRKLETNSIAEAALLANRMGLVSSDPDLKASE